MVVREALDKVTYNAILASKDGPLRIAIPNVERFGAALQEVLFPSERLR